MSTSGNLSIVTANWQLIYTLKNDPACKAPHCQPPSYPSSLGNVTTVWTLTPGVGWAVTDFRYQNGFTQGTLPAVPVPTNSSPDLEMEGVVAQGIPGNPIPIGVGAQTFVATVKNIGTAASTPTTVHFALSESDGTPLGLPRMALWGCSGPAKRHRGRDHHCSQPDGGHTGAARGYREPRLHDPGERLRTMPGLFMW